MKSVNRKDNEIKEKIRNDTKMKFQTQILKKNNREGLPPTASQVHGGTVPMNMQQINKLSPRRGALDDKLRGSTNYSTDMFKLEGKARDFNSRRGSRTNREKSEDNNSKFNFTRLQERRIEHKNQKNIQSTTSININKNYESLKNK